MAFDSKQYERMIPTNCFVSAYDILSYYWKIGVAFHPKHPFPVHTIYKLVVKQPQSIPLMTL